MASSDLIIALGFAVVCFSWATNTQAAGCTGYAGQTVAPGTIDDLLVELAKLPSLKDEFETTKAFEARMAAATAGTEQLRIVWVPLDSKYIKYDADARKLSVQVYAMANERTDYHGVFGYGTPYDGKIKTALGTLGTNINIVVRKPEETDGSFTGQNNFGAATNVTRVKRYTQALFEREGERGEDLFFPNEAAATARKHVIVEFPETSADIAKIAKAAFKAAVVIAPKWPFYAKGKVLWGPPTIQRPTLIDESLEVAVIDFQCALLTDGTGKVFAAIDTR